MVGGAPAPAWSPPGRWTHITWRAPSAPLEVSFAAPPGAVDIRWAEIIDGWPAGAAPLPPRPPEAMPWLDTDSTVLIGSARLAR